MTTNNTQNCHRTDINILASFLCMYSPDMKILISMICTPLHKNFDKAVLHFGMSSLCLYVYRMPTTHLIGSHSTRQQSNGPIRCSRPDQPNLAWDNHQNSLAVFHCRIRYRRYCPAVFRAINTSNLADVEIEFN